MITYSIIPIEKKPKHYSVILIIKSFDDTVFGFDQVDIYTDEENMKIILPKINEFLVNENQEYFEYDYNESNYIEISKIRDHHADGNFPALYAIHGIYYFDENGTKFLVEGFDY